MPCNFSLTFISYWSSSTCPCCWGKRMIWSNNCNASESDLIENQWSHDSPLLAVQHLFSSAFFNHMINWMAYCQSSCRQALLFTSIGDCDVASFMLRSMWSVRVASGESVFTKPSNSSSSFWSETWTSGHSLRKPYLGQSIQEWTR